ncbi:MAG: molecular chaperone [Nitriliruptoraceae bacterium]
MSRAELIRTLAAFAEPPGRATSQHAELLGLDRLPSAADHTELFGFQLYPYASVHLGPEGKLGGVARDRIAGFLRVLEVVPPPEPDHLVVLLDAYAQLVELDAAGGSYRVRRARTVLLHEHLASWLPRFTARVAELAVEPYGGWAHHLDGLLAAEVEELGAAPALPAHLREAPGLDGLVGQGRAAFVDGLLAPVRSGLVLARADLARAAGELDLGLRIGERAYTLDALLEQDVHAVLGWLAGEARRQQRAIATTQGPTERFWRERLEATAVLLERELAAREPVRSG